MPQLKCHSEGRGRKKNKPFSCNFALGFLHVNQGGANGISQQSQVSKAQRSAAVILQYLSADHLNSPSNSFRQTRFPVQVPRSTTWSVWLQWSHEVSKVTLQRRVSSRLGRVGFCSCYCGCQVWVCLLLQTPPAANKLSLDKELSTSGDKMQCTHIKERLRGTQ